MPPVVAVEKLESTIIPNAQGEIAVVDFNNTQDNTPVTGAGLVHLKGMTELRTLIFWTTNVTDVGIDDLQKALPNCLINR